MYKNFIAFDVNWQLLSFYAGIFFVIYIIMHLINYFLQRNKKTNLVKYIIKEIVNIISSVFYTLISALIILSIAYQATYISSIADKHKFKNGKEGIIYVILQDLNNTQILKKN